MSLFPGAHRLIAILAISAGAAFAENPATLTRVTGVDVVKDSAIVRGERAAIRVEFPRPNIVRLTASARGEFPADTTHPEGNGPYHIVSYPETPLRPMVRRTAIGWTIAAEGGKAEAWVEIDSAPFRLRVMRRTDGAAAPETVLATAADAFAFRRDRTEGRFAIEGREHFIGFGAHRHPLDMRGKSIVLTTTELGREGEGGGFPAPWVMSSRGYGLFLDNVDPTTRFDLGESRADTLRIDAGDGGKTSWNFDLYVVTGGSYAELLRGYLGLTGRPLLAEKWFFGNMQSKCCDWRAEDVMYIASRFRELQLPLDVMILDLQWREVRTDMWEWTPSFDETDAPDQRRNLEWTPTFGDYRRMFRRLDELGVKVGMHENTRSTYSEGPEGPGAYLAKAFPDLTDPAVAQRMWEMHRPPVADGADFWWQDQGEQMVGRGKYGYPATNLNGSLWAKLVYEGMRREFGISIPVLSRSGPVGGHRYISPWPGDVPAGLAFAPLDLDYVRNGGLAGYATIGADMGGFYHGSTPDEENEIRRICDMLLVFPVTRTHGAYYKLPWMFAHEAQLTYSRYLDLRYRLLPYLYSAAIEAHETGRPILAPLCFDYGDDEETYRRDFDLLLGRDLLVAPVTTSTDRREVYLPKGNWRNFWTDDSHPGGRAVTLPAPLRGGKSLPMLVREGAILPMTAPMLSIQSKLFDRYTFHVYPAPGAESRREFKDRARASDESSIITAQVNDSAESIRFVVEGAPSVESLYFHSGARPTEVRVNGKLLSEQPMAATGAGWSYGASDFPLQGATTVLKVRLPDGRAPGSRLECVVRK